MHELDRADKALLAALQEDGRMSLTDLAQKVGLSPTATTERFKRLQRDGFITGFKALLDPKLLGRGFLVFVEVLLDKTTPDIIDRFKEAAKRTPEILECHLVAGGFDYLIKTRLADMEAYRVFLGDKLWAMPGVKETRTYAVMEEVKSDGPLPIG
ncbi:Lrp/AsnC ligand binding domain-containing protein [Terrarubrum flagellatum]|uniref:Lrp/AsnC ligand binding domain-containing protein n=1 Tax=Terrirubrum flagellatum TaxID=2895980 RepID=UPI003144FAA1